MADRRIPWLLVFPTHVGVYLDVENYLRPAQCFPHTRGGVPLNVPEWGGDIYGFPHIRGSMPYVSILFSH